MWRKILLGLGLFLIAAIAGLYFSLPIIAKNKLYKALENADSASFSQLEIDFWEGDVILRDLYVLDTSGQLAGQPIKLSLERISVRGFDVIKMFKQNIAQADSFVLGRGSIELPIFKSDTSKTDEKRKRNFLRQISVHNVFLDSVDFKIGLHQKDKSQYASGTIVIDAKAVNIPINTNSMFTWQGNFALYNTLVNDSVGTIAKMPLHLKLDRLEFLGLNANDLQEHGRMSADKIFIGKGKIYAVLGDRDSTEMASKTPKEKFLSNILLNHFQVDSLDLAIILNAKNKRERIETSVSCKSDNIVFPLNKSAALSYENLTLSIDNTFIWPKKSIAYYTIKNCTYNADEKSLAIHDFKMRQSISETAYAKHFGFDKTYVKLDVYETILLGIPHNLKQLGEGVSLSKMNVLGLQAYLYKDKNMPHPSTPKPFPIEALSQLKFPIYIDEIEVTDSQLLYNENRREDYVPGRISLADIHVKISNVSSTGPTKKGNWTNVKGKLTILNGLKLDVDWRFDLRTKGKNFTLDLGIGHCRFESLNPFTENTVGARFKKGTIQGGRLLVSGDKTSGSGTLDLYYQNMRIEFLDKQSHEKNIVEWAGAGLANLVVKNNNLKNNKPKQGIVYAEPKPDREIYGFIVRLFFAGLTDIALGSNNERKIEQQKQIK